MNYTFKLQLPKSVQEETVSQILSELVDEIYPSTRSFHAIRETVFSPIQTEDEIVQKMLLLLNMTSFYSVAYCCDCNTFTVGLARRDTCAYDTDGMVDSHKVYRITILPPDIRKFFRVWGEDYQNKAPDTVGIEAFTEDSGYDQRDQILIKKLSVGEAWTDNLHGPHTVVRVE